MVSLVTAICVSTPKAARAFPSGRPYVTLIGATQVNPGAEGTDSESARKQVVHNAGGLATISNIFV
ncbi:hypothetical protein JAAARDRAFT_33232 [Jaapia argillacea MUCL 33604]|uniref:Uncharacterized protein n=1 Tax=Jaapia argillacea MUCL 33604 TaxID=933084 RepID=A0A067QAP6_9AGAM|nr:hypothetical protein JAAARDRAFT_33232 [Jaapia argillacea MUCL 33604]